MHLTRVGVGGETTARLLETVQVGDCCQRFPQFNGCSQISLTFEQAGVFLRDHVFSLSSLAPQSREGRAKAARIQIHDTGIINTELKKK